MITLNEICGYLPYGLNVQTKARKYSKEHEKLGYKIGEIYGIYNQYGDDISVIFREDEEILDLNFSEIKPILRPLSDLANEYELENYGDGKFMELANIYFFEQLKGNYQYATNMEGLRDCINNPMYLPYNLIKRLYEWHFDIHGLIDRGDAIDINSII